MIYDTTYAFYLQINIFAMIILFIIFLNVHKREVIIHLVKDFCFNIVCMFSSHFSDTILWIINGKPGKPIRYLSVFFIVLYNMFNPVICMLYYMWTTIFSGIKSASSECLCLFNYRSP